MKYYVHFLGINGNGLVGEVLGENGVFILDGRNSSKNMELTAIKQFHKRNKHKHSYCGWRIKKKSRFNNSTTIKEWILSGVPNGICAENDERTY